jgi:hypothetical protein
MVRIGKHSSNDIVVNDRLSEDFHCVIYTNDGQLRLCDQGSRFGTLVNGQKERDVLLSQGDVIQIGFSKIEWESKCLFSGSLVYDGHVTETYPQLAIETPMDKQQEIIVGPKEPPAGPAVVIPEKYLLDATGALISEWNNNLLERELDYDVPEVKAPEEIQALQPHEAIAPQATASEVSSNVPQESLAEQASFNVDHRIDAHRKPSQLKQYATLALLVLIMAFLGWCVAFLAQ